MSGVLLDTNAFIRMVLGASIRQEARDVIAKAAQADDLWISSVSAWEIGMLATATRTGRVLQISGDPVVWFEAAMSSASAQALPLSTAAAVTAARLPAPFHKDPADRLLVSQARADDLVVVTRDRAILDYAAAGHVRAIAC
jgi:PIN domain nuclease of toxin-antitoxin system